MNRLVRFAVAGMAGLLFCTASPYAASAVPSHHTAQAFTARNLALGSQGYDVDELQRRLKHLGYYKGPVDGSFSWQTYWAVRNFQAKFGIKPTGFVDMKTKMRLAHATPQWSYQKSVRHLSPHRAQTRSHSSPSGSMPTVPGVSQSDMRLMTHVVYGEARGEPYRGQVAIAAVILNRLQDPRFPHSVSAIVYQPGAFDAVSDGQVNLQPNAEARKAVVQAVHGSDPSHGAVYYFNPAKATSKWIWSRPTITKIGKHIFCR